MTNAICALYGPLMISFPFVLHALEHTLFTRFPIPNAYFLTHFSELKSIWIFGRSGKKETRISTRLFDVTGQDQVIHVKVSRITRIAKFRKIRNHTVIYVFPNYTIHGYEAAKAARCK